jgi:hypothetical protein
MPTIPGYNQWATEEAGLTRAKRRVLKNMQSGIVKLTEKPVVDVSNGSADQIAGSLITLYEDLTVTLRQMLAYGEEATDVKILLKAVSYAILSARTVVRIYRLVNQLLPVMRYMDLGILSDLKAAKSETDELITGALYAIRGLEFTREELEVVPDDDTLANYDPLDDDTRYTPPQAGIDYSEDDDMSVMSDVSSRSSRSRRTSRSSRDASLVAALVAAYNELGRVSSDSSLSTTVDGIRDSEEVDPSVRSKLIKQYDDMSDISSLTGTSGATPRNPSKLFRQVLQRTSNLYGTASDLLDLGFQTFNAFRQQRVLPAKSDVADVSNAVRTGAGVYRIGGSSDIYQKIDRFV